MSPSLDLCEPPPTTAAPEAAVFAVTIVSDVLLYREGLAASLSGDRRLAIRELVSAAESLPVIAAGRPDVVLLDGGMDGCLALARKIRTHVPGVKIVGFGISGGADRLVDCAESGLCAFVGSRSGAAELIDVIIGALQGELACSPEVSALMCERLANLAAGGLRRPDALTVREREVAILIGKGLSNKEIARDLRIGPSTVKNHVHSILEKLNVRRRSAIAHQLSELPWMRETKGARS